MKILNNLLDKLHANYIERVAAEREKIKEWSNDKLNGYIDSYLNHGSLWDTFFGEPARIEACIEVYGQRITNELYKPK